MAGIYARQKHPLIDALLLSGRSRFGHQRAIPRQDGVRPAIAAVEGGYPVLLSADQDYGAANPSSCPSSGCPQRPSPGSRA